MTENFDYAAGDNIASHNWTAHSGVGTNPIKVTSGGLTYSGYASSGIGNAAAIAAVSGEDDNRLFSSRSSGSLYAAFLVNVSAAPTAADYILGFYQSTTIFYGRVSIQKSGSSIAFGISKYSDTPTYTSYSYSLNTTYLVVVKYTFNSSSQDDTVALYVNPTPGGPEPSATTTAFTAANTDSVGLIAVFFRQGTAVNMPAVVVDGIRVATTWADAVAAATVTIDNTGAPAAGNITAGTSDVVLLGFKLTPSATVDFTALDLTTAGTATPSDLSNFRVVYDADDSGTYNTGDSIVSGSGQSLANLISFTISSQTGFSAARRYLVIADVASGATAGYTFTASIASAGDVTTTGTESGTATGNQQTITSAACTSPTTSFAVAGGGSYCAGGAGVAVGLSGSQNGVTYQLYKDSVGTGQIVAGTGSAISFGNQTATGTYTVWSTSAGGYCVEQMVGNPSSVTVSVNALPTITLGSNPAVCRGTTSAEFDLFSDHRLAGPIQHRLRQHRRGAGLCRRDAVLAAVQPDHHRCAGQTLPLEPTTQR